MELNYCYHTHTYRCGHAKGTDEEYVLKAIEHGIKRLGFSDHVIIKDKHQKGTRADFKDLEDYINSINFLKGKYKDQIEIHLGFECEYSPFLLSWYDELKTKYGIEYFLLGQHCYFSDDESGFFYFNNKKINKNKYADLYVNHLIQGMETGLFTYVAHPDLYVISFSKWNKKAERLARRICEAAVKNDIPLELNVNGRTWNSIGRLIYSCEEFWKIVSEYNIKTVIGYDAHSPDHFDRSVEWAFDWIKKYNLNFIDPFK